MTQQRIFFTNPYEWIIIIRLSQYNAGYKPPLLFTSLIDYGVHKWMDLLVFFEFIDINLHHFYFNNKEYRIQRVFLKCLISAKNSGHIEVKMRWIATYEKRKRLVQTCLSANTITKVYVNVGPLSLKK